MGRWGGGCAYREGERSLVLVVFIGGVTFAEISCLRFLSAQVLIFFLQRVIDESFVEVFRRGKGRNGSVLLLKSLQ